MGKIVKSVFVFCFICFLGLAMRTEAAVYEQYVDEIVGSVTREMAKEHGLICYGTGGNMPTNVGTIALDFLIYRKASIAGAVIPA